MKEKVIIIERDGSSYTCESRDRAASLTGNSARYVEFLISTGQADAQGRTYDVAPDEKKATA